MRAFRLFLLGSLIILFQKNIFADEPLKPIYTQYPPTINGILDDQVWIDAPSISGFKTFIPDFSQDMAGETVVYMAYDRENLYFAYKCYDNEPDKIKASVTSRDNIRAEDWICINLDSFNDQQALYAFYVNPFGIQADSRYAGGAEDEGMDFIWYSAGKINDEGYIVEVQIPLKSIRYADSNPVEMAVFFERKISRYSQQGSYPALDPAQGYSFLTQLKPMVYPDVEHYTLLEILPAVTYGERYAHKDGDMVTENVTKDLSLTMKYGITSDLIFDGTYNPDFSQVEADAGQVDINLRQSLYYSEKRPFFLEGRENFWVAATYSSEVDPLRSIVHTRTIVNPLVGAKLTGKIGDQNTLAVIYAMDELRDDITATDNYAHFPIVRYKRALSDDSFIGGIAASRELKNSFNRIGGIDGQIRISESSQIELHGLVTQSKDDETSEKMSGHSIGLRFKSTSRDIDYDFTFRNISENFKVDMGYVGRTGVMTGTALVRPRIYPEWDFIQRLDAEAFTAQTKDLYYDRWETFNHASLNAFFGGKYQFKVKYSYSTEIFLGERFKTGGFHIYAGGQFSRNLSLEILYRNIDAIYYSDTPFQGKSNRVTASLIYQPSDKLRSEVDFVFYDFYKKSGDEKIYDYPLARCKLTYQMNKYLFFRGVIEYNEYKKELLTDFLASFTYIPGTVIHLGYGSIYNRLEFVENEYRSSNNFMEMRKGFFFKASYLWRL